MNNITDRVEVVRISNAGVMSKTGEIDVSTIAGYAGMNSLAVANGLLAVAIESSPKSANGLVALFEVATGSLVKTITVGALPDMLTFSPDGLTLLVANEGRTLRQRRQPAGPWMHRSGLHHQPEKWCGLCNSYHGRILGPMVRRRSFVPMA